MNEELKEELLAQFRRYLETEFNAEAEADAESSGVDQLSVFGELAALKNEVRIESRQVKAALEDFREAFNALDGANQELVRLVRSSRDERREQELFNAVALELIDLYDRIAAGLAKPAGSPSLLERWFGGGSYRRLQAYFEGQSMLQGHLLAVLARYGVRPLEAVGKHFDPETMKAIGFARQPRLQDGLVLTEDRKGFLAAGRCLRPAEVTVNKHR